MSQPAQPKPGQDTIIVDPEGQRAPAHQKSLSYWLDAVERTPFKPSQRTVTRRAETFTDTARVDVTSDLNGTTLRLTITVRCNPEYMCFPHDLVPLSLEPERNKVIPIDVLEIHPEQNVVEVKLTYDLDALAKALVGKDSSAHDLPRRYPELGILAQWLANRNGVNGPNHASGGLLEKGGSGKIFLRARTADDFKQADEVTPFTQNREWNMSERLTADRKRPVLLAFGELLREGKELATTLEAEAEYEVDEPTLGAITSRMKDLLAIVQKNRSLRTGERGDDVPSRIRSMEREEKTYEDFYFDLVGKDGSGGYPLLTHGIVLRRRSVPSKDPKGTYLFAVKGASRPEKVLGPLPESAPWARAEQERKRKQERLKIGRIRLAAQVHLVEQVVEGKNGADLLKRFLCDRTNLDNAFARILRHALAECKLAELLDEPDRWSVVPVLKVTSTRVKYAMQLVEDTTVIEFSADRAVGEGISDATSGNGSATVHSFELGVGHPGLNTANTPGGSGGSVRSRVSASSSAGTIVRPYHVPDDLFHSRHGEAVFAKPDYRQFRSFSDDLVSYLGLAREDLKPGGYKASVLAHKMGLVKELALPED